MRATRGGDVLMSKLILFDIDGTLVLTGGAGLRALERAFERVFGLSGAFEGVEMPGRTDQVIIADALERAGLQPEAALQAQFHETYCEYIREEIRVPAATKGTMPGVRELLDVLVGREDAYLGLLTGNFVATARIKLEHFGLWHYFRCGAYGDDAADRNHLMPVALERAGQSGVPPVANHDVLVVGDTPRDVACALAAGARPVAVATGRFDVATLQAAGAEVVFANLEDLDSFIALLEVGAG